MTPDEILDNTFREDCGFPFLGLIANTSYEGLKSEAENIRHSILDAMKFHAKQESIEFFKWYTTKITGLIVYITDIRPRVISQEIEAKIEEFEGKSLSDLYELFQQSKTIEP